MVLNEQNHRFQTPTRNMTYSGFGINKPLWHFIQCFIGFRTRLISSQWDVIFGLCIDRKMASRYKKRRLTILLEQLRNKFSRNVIRYHCHLSPILVSYKVY